jgi:hypothetical protein
MSLKARKVFDDHEHFIILHQRWGRMQAWFTLAEARVM